MNEYHNQIAMQFAQSNRQEQRQLREELEIIVNLLKAAIIANKGSLQFSERDIQASKMYSLEIHKNQYDMTTELTLKLKD